MRHEEWMKAKLKQFDEYGNYGENNPPAGKVAQANVQSDNVDMVNSPPHYNKAGIECVDAIAAATEDGFEYYLQGNIMKYLWRYRYKNGLEDLNKAKWYLDKLIEVYDES